MEALSKVGYGQPTITQILLTGTLGCIAQAIGVGSCLQLCYQYFAQSRRDGKWGRLGVIWITSLVVISAILCNLQNTRNISLGDRYPSGFFLDWWLLQLEACVDAFVLVPVCLFLTYRAFILWDRSKVVLVSCLAMNGVSISMGLIYVAMGLRCPWGLWNHTDEELEAWLPEFQRIFIIFYPLSLTTFVLLFCCSTAISILICIGILRYRGGLVEMDSAISRVVMLCSESLLPMVLLSATLMIASATKSPNASLILRVTTQLIPSFYSYSLLTSLVWRERVARILQADPVRNIAALNAQLQNHTEDKSLETTHTPLPLPLQWNFQPTPIQQGTPTLQQQSKISDPASTTSPLPKSVSLARRSGTPPSFDSGRMWTSTANSLELALPYEEETRRGSDLVGLGDMLSNGPIVAV